MNPAEDDHRLSEKTFSASEVKLNYAEGDDNGPPLVLLHGLGRRWQVFLPLIPDLSPRWHIYALDLRGHGGSSHVARSYRVTQYAKDVVGFLGEQVEKPAVLFGHSLGGMIAMTIAAEHPGVVRALILGDNAVCKDDFENSLYLTLFAALRDLTLRRGSLEEIARDLARIKLKLPGLDERVAIGDLPGNDRAYLLAWARCLAQVDPDTYAMTLDRSVIDGWDGEQLLPRITCPTLLLQASSELGGLMTDADVKRAFELLPHPAHVHFATLGHALYMQQPEPVLRAVNEFLKSLH